MRKPDKIFVLLFALSLSFCHVFFLTGTQRCQSHQLEVVRSLTKQFCKILWVAENLFSLNLVSVIIFCLFVCCCFKLVILVQFFQIFYTCDPAKYFTKCIMFKTVRNLRSLSFWKYIVLFEDLVQKKKKPIPLNVVPKRRAIFFEYFRGPYIMNGIFFRFH